MRTLTTILLPIGTLILGAWLSHLGGTRLAERELRNRQRIDFLLNAYRAIEDSSNRPQLTSTEIRALEKAVADVNLLGSAEQQKAIQYAQEKMADTGNGQFNKVLCLLRAELRNYLGIDPGLADVRFFRMSGGDWGAEAPEREQPSGATPSECVMSPAVAARRPPHVLGTATD